VVHSVASAAPGATLGSGEEITMSDRVLDNPATGERFVFTDAGTDEQGRIRQLRYEMKPGAKIIEHSHVLRGPPWDGSLSRIRYRTRQGVLTNSNWIDDGLNGTD
jgi:hypothetical protein